MEVAGVLLFRPTQLKLDGILTCTCMRVYTTLDGSTSTAVPVQLVASANFYMLKFLPYNVALLA